LASSELRLKYQPIGSRLPFVPTTLPLLMGGVVMDEDVAPLRAAFQESLLTSPGGRIAAGTDEILRNIIAERVLGLPQDVRVDRDLPFEQLPTGNR